MLRLPDEIVIEDEPERLISWAMTIDPTADMYLFPSLTYFEVERQQMSQLRDPKGDDRDAYDALFTKVTNYKALCIVDICFRKGATSSDRKKDIMDSMITELERCGLRE
jgi:hypothetical protein